MTSGFAGRGLRHPFRVKRVAHRVPRRPFNANRIAHRARRRLFGANRITLRGPRRPFGVNRIPPWAPPRPLRCETASLVGGGNALSVLLASLVVPTWTDDGVDRIARRAPRRPFGALPNRSSSSTT